MRSKLFIPLGLIVFFIILFGPPLDRDHPAVSRTFAVGALMAIFWITVKQQPAADPDKQRRGEHEHGCNGQNQEEHSETWHEAEEQAAEGYGPPGG